MPSLPFVAIVAALLILPGMRNLDASRDPLATIDPPPPPIAASTRAPTMDRIIRTLWWILLAGFCVSMLTWIPITWETVFNNGLTLSTMLLSITLITGMAGQLSLCQATLAGIGAFTAAELANHLGLNLLLGGLVGAGVAAIVAVVLALLSLRLRGLGLALMTLAAALLFDSTAFNDIWVTGGAQGTSLKSKWLGTSAFFNFDGHAMFLLAIGVLAVAVVVVLLVRKGTVGRNLAAMRGSETATAGLGVNPTWQRIVVFALSGAIAGVGGVLYSIQQQHVSPVDWNTSFSLVLVVLVVTTSVTTVEGAIQAGIGFFVTEQVLTFLPARFGGPSLTIVLFAFGALTYASHPEGVLEYQKRRWTLRFERLFFSRRRRGRAGCTRHLDLQCQWLTDPPQAAGGLQVLRRDPGRDAASRSTSRPARASAWSGPTAPARRRSSTASAGSCAPRPGEIVFDGTPLAGAAHLQARPPRASAAPTRRWRCSPTCRCATT